MAKEAIPDIAEWTPTDSGLYAVFEGTLIEVISGDDDLWHGYVDGRPVGAMETPEEAARLCAESMPQTV